jgi:tRNA threonylcarbamoyladenosine biosynthesis protein TsaB
MCYILNIETATTVCSVSLSKNGGLVFYKELNNGFTHAENLHVFIEAVLKESRITPKQLSAIAVSKGPGSYTGLRIGVSAAKGLAYALKLPLISIDTLQLMALQAKTLQKKNDFYCPMLDARRMEVYTAVYDNELIQQLPIEALIVDASSIQKFTTFNNILFFGDGMPKCKETLQVLKNATFIENITPSAKDMCKLAYDKFITKQVEDVAYFEPFYLKDFLILKKKM